MYQNSLYIIKLSIIIFLVLNMWGMANIQGKTRGKRGQLTPSFSFSNIYIYILDKLIPTVLLHDFVLSFIIELLPKFVSNPTYYIQVLF